MGRGSGSIQGSYWWREHFADNHEPQPHFRSRGSASHHHRHEFRANKGTSTVTFNGTTANPKSWSDTSIVVPVPAGASTGVVVVNVGGVASNGVTFTVKPPPPSIASLNPGSAVTGNGPFTLTVAGTNFLSSSTVQWNGSARTTSFVSSTQLQATIAAADISTVGVAKITVANPGP